jgi:hypothetical protein
MSSPPVQFILDGVTGSPVQATAETISGSGRQFVRVTAAGYLQRDTRFTKQVFLWPASDPAYVNTLVYGPFALGQRLSRWMPTVPFRSCVGNGVDRRTIQAALDLMTSATGVPATTDGADCNVTWEIDPTDTMLQQNPGYLALTYVEWSGFSIASARVVFRDRAAVAHARHEGGHVLGLGHSIRPTDLMAAIPGSTDDFSPEERIALTMMFHHRTPGNKFPDSDVDLGNAAASPRRHSIAN